MATAAPTGGLAQGGRKGALAKPKNIILLVADGMNQGTLSLAEVHCRRAHSRPSEWMGLYNQPFFVQRSLMETSSLTGIVTDSAAAGSAWSCGQKIDNGSLCVGPQNQVLDPLYKTLKAQGKRLGLVTTTRITHATPASFAVSHRSRNDEDVIAQKLLEAEVDVVLGGGARHFDSASRADKNDLLKAFEQAGYSLVRTCEALSQAPAEGRLLGLFSSSHIPYAIDRHNRKSLYAKVPKLPEMMRAALQRLQGAQAGFFLQVEAGRIDHAGHANDAGAILLDQLEFDRCIPVAVEFAKAHPDTLVIITTDHGTGGCIMNGVGGGYAQSNKAFDRITRQTASFEMLGKSLNQSSLGLDDLSRRLSKGLGVAVSEAEAGQIREAHSQDRNASADLMSARIFKETGVNFPSHNHTAELVELVAFGPGAQAIPNYLENWQLHEHLLF
jgi:alkaline phosphatase